MTEAKKEKNKLDAKEKTKAKPKAKPKLKVSDAAALENLKAKAAQMPEAKTKSKAAKLLSAAKTAVTKRKAAPKKKVLPLPETAAPAAAVKPQAPKPTVIPPVHVPAVAHPKTAHPQEAHKPKVFPQEAVLPIKTEKTIKEDKPAGIEKPLAVKEENIIPVKEEKAALVKEQKPAVVKEVAVSAPVLKELELKFPIIVKDLAIKLQEKSSGLIKTLMGLGVMAGLNQTLDEVVVVQVCAKYGFRIKEAPSAEKTILGIHEEDDSPGSLKHRSAIVTLMGHVDHGKTSLLDAIRKSKVTESEHGGITQHIGAYRVEIPHGEITFLDTPGHEAFTAMRARGASITDIVVLVVAADEGIMPQTQEALDHARAASVSIIIALNKIDKPTADVDRVKKQLSELNLVPEDWGGKTIVVGVSAKTGQGIDELLEMILLEAQMLELKANPDKPARGVVIEAKSNKYKGPVVTLLVKNGTLRLNDNIIVGSFYGKAKAMFNDRGQTVREIGPSLPVEVLGISGLPQAGEQFFVVENEKKAKELAEGRQEKEKELQMQPVKRLGLEDLYSQIKAGKIKELKLILKADAHGSLEAIKDTLGKIVSTEISLVYIHEGVGNINSSDVILAVASNALILGFNVVADDLAKDLISREGQEVRTYNIIYELANDIRAALEGMLEPKLKKVFLGRVEIRKVFKLSRSGIIAGSFVIKGKVFRNSQVSLVRNGEVVYEGELSSLKRFKDDVREVAEGFECGIALKGYDGIMEGDILEAYQIEKIARKL
ncbi:MAG: translation initiation factor IF-2 [Candidatus Omnitrophota bacterium]|jgi:translation initiation factor IF-2